MNAAEVAEKRDLAAILILLSKCLAKALYMIYNFQSVFNTLVLLKKALFFATSRIPNLEQTVKYNFYFFMYKL